MVSEVIDARFEGYGGTANGGYAAGIVARAIGATEVEATLLKPLRLGVPLRIERPTDTTAEIWDNDVKVAEGRAIPLLDLEVPASVSLEAATRATARYPWYQGHPAPRCFVCGGERHADGLRLFTGPVEGRPVVAAPLTFDASLADAHGHVRSELVWAALDCPSWFGWYAFAPEPRIGVLGRLHASILGDVRAGEPLVAIGWEIGVDGRKVSGGSAVYRASGELVGKARATWILRKDPS